MERGLVEAYASLFVQNWEEYAMQQADGSYWRIVEPLSYVLLEAHLLGRCTLGTYLMDREGCCGFAVLDADSEDGLVRLVQLAGELVVVGVGTLLEASRRGGHLWVHLAEVTPAWQVRAWLLPYALAYGVELYPKQDMLGPSGSGSLIRLPLGIHRQSRGWYPFLCLGEDGRIVPVGETVMACCQWACGHVERVAAPAVAARGPVVVPPGGQVGEGVSWPGDLSGGRGSIRTWCQAQDIVTVIGRYVRLDQRGVGSCPFKAHHYRGDRRPSFQVFGGSDPHWYCYAWGRAGDLFDFLMCYHGLSQQEAWQRLRDGTLL